MEEASEIDVTTNLRLAHAGGLLEDCGKLHWLPSRVNGKEQASDYIGRDLQVIRRCRVFSRSCAHVCPKWSLGSPPRPIRIQDQVPTVFPPLK